MRRWRFAVGLVAGVLVVAAPSASATPTWSVAPSPTPSGSTHGEISTVSCPSTTSCFAVGRYDTPSSSSSLVDALEREPLVEHGRPQTRRLELSRSGRGVVSEPDELLRGRLLRRTRDPQASGGALEREPLVDHDQPQPTGSAGTFLTGVSCPSPTSCFAVGSYDVSGTEKSLVEHWNGSAWGIMTSPNPTGATTSYLVGVSCPSPNSCFAVGSYQTTGGAEKSLLERWDGSTWGVMNSPNRASYVTLHGVSCPDTTNCYAVGYYDNNFPVVKGLVEHWVHGSPWSIMTSSNPSTDTELAGVSCPTPTSCVAVGHYSTASATFGLVERNN